MVACFTSCIEIQSNVYQFAPPRSKRLKLISSKCKPRKRGLALVFPSHAQNSQQDYVNAYNSAHAAVSVGLVTWDNAVAAFAQNYANQCIGDCALVDSGGGGKYGENLAGRQC
ncbi:hypothetical protein Patl1_37278 [Pistacia atlantica]|nr:hypothetical protein Patl1_37278 [Pistacia atlantica]